MWLPNARGSCTRASVIRLLRVGIWSHIPLVCSTLIVIVIVIIRMLARRQHHAGPHQRRAKRSNTQSSSAACRVSGPV